MDIKLAKAGNFEILVLKNYGLLSLPPEIGQMSSLKTLNVSHNSLTSIPDSIGDLSSLTNLDVSHNNLTSLPEKVRNLAESCLVITSNQCTSDVVAVSSSSSSNINSLLNLNNTLRSSSDFNELDYYGLQEWVHAGDENENRYLAAYKIIACKINNWDVLDFRDFGLRSLPSEIGKLTSVTQILLSRNSLETIPEEIEHLDQLEYLNISNNRLMNFTHKFANMSRNSQMTIHLNMNDIPNSIADELRDVYYQSGVRLFLGLQRRQEPPIVWSNVGSQTTPFYENLVLDQVLNTENSEKKKGELRSFVEGTTDSFQRFLKECSRTSGWSKNRDEMSQGLFTVIDAMSKSANVKDTCESIATQAFDTCGDRVSLAFVTMQMSLNIPDKKIDEMTLYELYEGSKQQAISGYLLDKAKVKVEELDKIREESVEIRARELGKTIEYVELNKLVPGVEEIEVHLAYLQVGKELGLTLETSMLFRFCAKVSDQELETVKSNMQNIGIDTLVARYIYNDDRLKTHPVIQGIITNLGKEEQYNSDVKDGENNEQYAQRLKNVSELFSRSAVEKIKSSISSEQPASNTAVTDSVNVFPANSNVQNRS